MIAYALLLARLFSPEECRAVWDAALEVGTLQAAQVAVLEKWQELKGAVSPGEVAAALREDCGVVIPTEAP